MFTRAGEYFSCLSTATLRPVLKLISPFVFYIIETDFEVVPALANFVLIAHHPVLVSSNGIAVIRAVESCADANRSVGSGYLSLNFEQVLQTILRVAIIFKNACISCLIDSRSEICRLDTNLY